ncbi:MAG: hypothetical protein P8179_01740 [Candidatus Thiodiazotropha sp.]
MKALPIFFFLILLLIAMPVLALNGWTITDKGNIRLYAPNDLQDGKVLAYMVSGPYELNGTELKEWFSGWARKVQEHFGKPLNEWLVEPEKGGWSIINQYIDKKSGKRLNVCYIGGMLDSKRAYFITWLSSVDSMLILKYKTDYDKVLNDAMKHLLAQPSVTNSSIAATEPVSKNQEKPKQSPKSKSQQISEQIRVAPDKGADLGDIELVWVYSSADILEGGFDVDTHLLFEDGTAYKDCQIPPDELDIDVSKRLEPDKWTEWRKHWGTYQMKNKEDGNWYDLEGGPGIKAPEGTQLSGEYLSAHGSANFAATQHYITFHDNGRFEMSSLAISSNSSSGGGSMGVPYVGSAIISDKNGTSTATSIAGGSFGGGVSSERKNGSKNTGSYEVHDYTITLVHDNGLRHTELFFMLEEKKESDFIYINDDYWLEESTTPP